MDERIRSIPIAAADGRATPGAMQEIARRCIPALADFAVVFMVTGRLISGIASAHTSTTGERLLRALRRVYRIRRDDLQSTVAQVVRTGYPLLRRSIQHEEHAARRGSVSDLHRRLACRSALVLPIRVGTIVTGALSLCYSESGRTYALADLACARRVAREIANTVPPILPHAAAPRLRAATGDTRRHAAIRRRVAPRN